MSTSTSTYNGPQLKCFSSSSRVPLGRTQIQMEPSSDQVIFIANLKGIWGIYLWSAAFHQAILFVTQKKKNWTRCWNFEYHIVEHMQDSRAHCYMINFYVTSKPNSLKDLVEFQDEQYFLEKMSINQQFDIDTQNIKVEEIREIMQKITDENREYDLEKNNCQILANKLTTYILLKEISNKNVTFQAQIEKQDDGLEEGE